MNRPRGYILPMTLALLAIASLMLARVCRDGMRQAVRVHSEADELQRKWGMLSCQATYLGRTASVLEAAEKRSGRPAPILQATVNLGGQQFGLRFADESAKVNLNALASQSGMASIEQFVRSEARQNRADVQIHLRPTRLKQLSNGYSPIPVFASFGQVYDESGASSPLAIESATANLTCWGSGKLNVKRASVGALMQMLHGDRQLIRRILELQATPENASAENVLGDGADATKSLVKLLGDASDAQSLWITSGSRARFAVRQLRENGQDDVTVFSWQP